MRRLEQVAINLLVLLVAVGIASFGYVLYDAERDARIEQHDTALVALCAFKSDLRGRRDRTAEYLREHPRGIVSPKSNDIIISAAELQRGIDAQNSTLAALGPLDCS